MGPLLVLDGLYINFIYFINLTKLNIHFKASYRTLITQLVSLYRTVNAKTVDQLF